MRRRLTRKHAWRKHWKLPPYPIAFWLIRTASFATKACLVIWTNSSSNICCRNISDSHLLAHIRLLANILFVVRVKVLEKFIVSTFCELGYGKYPEALNLIVIVKASLSIS